MIARYGIVHKFVAVQHLILEYGEMIETASGIFANWWYVGHPCESESTDFRTVGQQLEVIIMN